MSQEKEEFSKVFRMLSKIMGPEGLRQDSAPLIMVNPKTADDVSKVLRFAESKDVPVFPARDMPWLVMDKQFPVAIVLNTSFMNKIHDIDRENLTVTVGPGVTWKGLYKELSKGELSLGAYPGYSILTVGDWMDCGGAGIGSYLHGFAGDQIRTMDIVLPNGRFINTGFQKVLPNSSGYNLNGIFAGSDSTLGVITKVTLKLIPKPQRNLPIYFTFKNTDDMTNALVNLVRQKFKPMNISFFEKTHIKYLSGLENRVNELDDFILNVTLSGLNPVVVHDEKIVTRLIEKQGAQRIDSTMTKALWERRFFDGHSKKKRDSNLISPRSLFHYQA